MSLDQSEPVNLYWQDYIPYSYDPAYNPLGISQIMEFRQLDALLAIQAQDSPVPSVECSYAPGTSDSSPKKHDSCLERNMKSFQAAFDTEKPSSPTQTPAKPVEHRTSMSSTLQDYSTPPSSIATTEPSLSMSPEPLPEPTDSTASSQERRRRRRREQNRKAQFTFRQKRKDEVRRLQSEVADLKSRLAAKEESWKSERTGALSLCSLCKRSAEQCR